MENFQVLLPRVWVLEGLGNAAQTAVDEERGKTIVSGAIEKIRQQFHNLTIRCVFLQDCSHDAQSNTEWGITYKLRELLGDVQAGRSTTVGAV